MPEQRSVSPEKELLKLIEKPMHQNSLQAAAIKYHGLSIFSLGALKGRVSFLKSRFKDGFKPETLQQFDVKILNLVLKVCVFVLACYFIVNLAFSISNLKKDFNLKLKPQPAENTSTNIASFLKAASYYLEKARERDIFRMGVKKTAITPNALNTPSQRIIEVTAHLRLVGISWSDDPDVMIEDTKNQRTLFLKKGQTIDNEIRIKAVFKDKVVLSFAGEEIDLK
jgi:type II secretory pathway component PulC